MVKSTDNKAHSEKEMGGKKQEFLELSGHLRFMYNKMREIESKISELSGEYHPMAGLLDSNDPRGYNWEEKSKILKEQIDGLREAGFPVNEITSLLERIRTMAQRDTKSFKEKSKEFSRFIKKAKKDGIDDYLKGELASVADTYKLVKNVSISSMRDALRH